MLHSALPIQIRGMYFFAICNQLNSHLHMHLEKQTNKSPKHGAISPSDTPAACLSHSL